MLNTTQLIITEHIDKWVKDHYPKWETATIANDNSIDISIQHHSTSSSSFFLLVTLETDHIRIIHYTRFRCWQASTHAYDKPTTIQELDTILNGFLQGVVPTEHTETGEPAPTLTHMDRLEEAIDKVEKSLAHLTHK